MAEVFVTEGSSPRRDLPRWGCRGTPGFDDVDEAVAAGLANAETVIVQTVDGQLFWAGSAPSAGYRARPWPPSDTERRRIDDTRADAMVAEERAQVYERAYAAARERWMSDHVPQLIGAESPFVCWVVPPRRNGPRDLRFEELSADGRICAAHDGAGRWAFGTAHEVLAGAAGRAADDPWIQATVSALARTWSGGTRRTFLLVKRGRGEMFHLSPTVNRASIAAHGLDWRRMTGSGIAGNTRPQAAAIFVCAEPHDIDFFARMRTDPCDVWAVRVEGLWLEGDLHASGGGASNWMIAPQAIAPDRLRLVHRDVMRRPRAASRLS